MSFLTKLRAWRTARRRRKLEELEEYVEKTIGTRPVVYEEGTPSSGGYAEH